MIEWAVGGNVSQVKVGYSARTEKSVSGGEEKVIPWAEGNGLWHTINSLVSDLADVDVITLFVQNPYTCDTAESIAAKQDRLDPARILCENPGVAIEAGEIIVLNFTRSAQATS